MPWSPSKVVVGGAGGLLLAPGVVALLALSVLLLLNVSEVSSNCMKSTPASSPLAGFSDLLVRGEAGSLAGAEWLEVAVFTLDEEELLIRMSFQNESSSLKQAAVEATLLARGIFCNQQ